MEVNMINGLMLGTVIVCVVCTIVLTFLQIKKDKKNKVINKSLIGIIENLNAELEIKDKDIEALNSIKKDLLSEKKSLEVRAGQITEHLVPFMKDFKHDPKTVQFLGNPLDYIIFGKEAITFLEVKTNKSKESKKQKDIRKLIEEGKVRYELVTIDV